MAARHLLPAARRGAREGARMVRCFPKAAYMTEMEILARLADDRIEFVMRRLPTAD